MPHTLQTFPYSQNRIRQTDYVSSGGTTTPSPSADLQYRAADFGAKRAALIYVQRDTACFVM